MKYCAYQERSHSEVRNKLKSLKVDYEIVEQVISELISQDFLNEERFARAFARGKFNLKGWGKRKIVTGLKSKEITDQCIALGLREIKEEDYLAKLNALSEKALAKYAGKHKNYKEKAAVFLIGRGFEPPLVWDILKRHDL